MYYHQELSFLRRLLSKMRIHTAVVDPDNISGEELDFGLRKSLGLNEEYYRKVADVMGWIRGNTIYKLTDAYSSNYIFMILPDTDKKTALMIGPYMLFEMSSRQLMEQSEKYGIDPRQLRQMEKYYAHIPVIDDEMPLFNMANTLAESLWGEGSEYDIVDINRDMPGAISELPYISEGEYEQDMSLQMKLMESRYEYENQLMDAVAKGLSHRAEKMLSQASEKYLEQRGANPLRSIKNYCIICNTLMRKAAERGGVHPLHLDETSSEFAKKIEAFTDMERGSRLMAEMARAYCRLVRKSSIGQYTPQIQKTVMRIQENISGNLSLSALAKAQNLTPSYLSALFRKETGKSITEYVTEKRLELAARLLKSTQLQIQTVALHCGMADANYFSRLFKAQYGVTPKQFRNA